MAMRPKPCIYPALAWTRGSVGRGGSLPTMYDDAAFIAKELVKLADEGKEVVIVAHSYGGTPSSECPKGLGKEERQKQGKKGGLVRIAYVSCLVPAVGSPAMALLSDIPVEQRSEILVDVSLPIP